MTRCGARAIPPCTPLARVASRKSAILRTESNSLARVERIGYNPAITRVSRLPGAQIKASHNPEVVGSNPTPATFPGSQAERGFQRTRPCRAARQSWLRNAVHTALCSPWRSRPCRSSFTAPPPARCTKIPGRPSSPSTGWTCTWAGSAPRNRAVPMTVRSRSGSRTAAGSRRPGLRTLPFR